MNTVLKSVYAHTSTELFLDLIDSNGLFPAFIDLLDENGKLANVHQADPQDNIIENFEDRLIYIPVMLESMSVFLLSSSS